MNDRPLALTILVNTVTSIGAIAMLLFWLSVFWMFFH